MRSRQHTAMLGIALLSLLILGAAFAVSAQERIADTSQQTDQGYQAMPNRTIETQHEADQVRKTAVSASRLSAALIQPEQKAKQHDANVQVQVTEMDLVDPATTNEKPPPGQGHLHYQPDSGPVIATTAAKLSFHKLSPGKHQITVMLAGNDHNSLGPKERLHVPVPGR